jgi:hypothetical protein
MKIDFRLYDPGGGVTVFQDPPVKCKITGHRRLLQLAVERRPPPTVQTSPVLIINTEFRSFVVPIDTPFVQANPFQW